MIDCPACSGLMTVIESHPSPRGRRRRWVCRSCQHRRTTWGDVQQQRRGLSEEAVADILSSSEPRSRLARRWRCSYNTIQRVQVGDRHAEVLPELRRWPREYRPRQEVA